MATGDRHDPYLGFNFAVEIGSVIVAGFSEVSGLASESEVHEYREGGVNEFTHKRAGPIKYPSNLVLKRGISDAAGLWSWYTDVMQGKIERKSVSIVLMNGACEEQLRWNFQRAYPAKWSGPALRGAASEVAVESMELVHDGLAPAVPSRPTLSVSVGLSFSLDLDISASFTL